MLLEGHEDADQGHSDRLPATRPTGLPAGPRGVPRQSHSSLGGLMGGLPAAGVVVGGGWRLGVSALRTPRRAAPPAGVSPRVWRGLHLGGSVPKVFGAVGQRTSSLADFGSRWLRGGRHKARDRGAVEVRVGWEGGCGIGGWGGAEEGWPQIYAAAYSREPPVEYVAAPFFARGHGFRYGFCLRTGDVLALARFRD